MDRLCPKIPLAFYGTEALPGMRRESVHAFLGVVQRDEWIMASKGRKVLSPTSPLVWAAWGDFSLILHPDDRKRMHINRGE